MANLEPYIELVSALVERGMDPKEFEQRFFQLYDSDDTIRPEAEFLVLDQLFGDTEVFEGDPEVHAHLDYTIDADELRRCASEALTKLRALAQKEKLD